MIVSPTATAVCGFGLLAILQGLPYCASFSTRAGVGRPAAAAKKTADSNVNFEDWIADQPAEVTEWKELTDVEGRIPEYLSGTWIRNGGGIWSASDDDSFSHVFDGFAKISAYRFAAGRVRHQARFLEGSWYRKFRSEGSLPPSIGTGPILDARDAPKVGGWRIVRALYNVATAFDNAPVNLWDFDPLSRHLAGETSKAVTALTDAPPRVRLGYDSMDTLGSTTMNSFAKGARGYELLITAHPLYSLESDDTYNVAVEIGLDGKVRVNLVREGPGGDRAVVGSFEMADGENEGTGEAAGGIPYFHSFGLSRNYAVIVVQPLRMGYDPNDLLERGFLRSMRRVDRTRIVVLDVRTGGTVLDQSVDDPLFFYHGISTAEMTVSEEDDPSSSSTVVSFRVCAYQEPSQLTGDHQFLRLEQARMGKRWRNKIHEGGRFCDLICNLNECSVSIDWKDVGQGFELPVTKYSRAHGAGASSSSAVVPVDSHPRYVYSFGAYALGSENYDSWGLFKFDTEGWDVVGCYRRDSVYLSEPFFVADPDGRAEDDGVLLCQAYFGVEWETKLLVLDARTMEVIATAGIGMRTPMDFHGAWFPDPS